MNMLRMQLKIRQTLRLKCIMLHSTLSLLLIMVSFVPAKTELLDEILNENNASSSTIQQQVFENFAYLLQKYSPVDINRKRFPSFVRLDDFCGNEDVESVFRGPSADKFIPNFIVFDESMKETRLNELVPADLIKRAGFDESKRTIILVHGHTESYPNSTWLVDTRDLIFKNSASKLYNLIIMDWGQYASQGDYFVVVKRTKAMGIYLSDFIKKLIVNLNYDRMKIHIVAHSLGSHVTGFAAKLINPKIGRVTALDSAGPCFGKIFSESDEHRLAPTDAAQIEVIHYDDGFLGLPGHHGQIDIYVNGGREQPGITNDFISVLRGVTILLLKSNDTLSYSHKRSIMVASMQIDENDCQHVAYECKDYRTFMDGKCGKCNEQNDQCFLMDLPYQFKNPIANESRFSYNLSTFLRGKKLFIRTGSVDNLCLKHYQVIVRTKLTTQMLLAAEVGLVYLDLELISNNKGSNVQPIKITTNNQLKPGIFSYLLLLDHTHQGLFKGARIKMRSTVGIFDILPNVVNVEITYMSNIDPVKRQNRSTIFCKENNMKSDSWINLGPCKKNAFNTHAS